MENIHDYSSFLALNEAAVSGAGFTLVELCQELRTKKIIRAKTPASWPLIPSSKLKKGEKPFTGDVKVNGKPINPVMPIKSTDKISAQNGTIQFDDITGFGQAELVVKAGKPELSISTE